MILYFIYMIYIIVYRFTTIQSTQLNIYIYIYLHIYIHTYIYIYIYIHEQETRK